MTRFCLPILAALSLSSFAAGQPAKDNSHHAAYEECAKACNDCQRLCDMCASHCGKLVAEGKKEHLTTMRTCQDCATHCSAAACIVARMGPFSDLICTACADARVTTHTPGPCA